MFNTLKKLFGRRGGAVEDAPSEVEHGEDAFVSPGASRSVRVDAQPLAPGRLAGGAPASVGIPLKSILGRLPADLMQRVRQTDIGELEVQIPTQKILSQISTGAVRISFGELRQLSPPGTFTAENDRDRTMVDLPLYEVLSRLNPGLLMRRPAQKHVDVPPEILGPFSGQNKVTISTSTLKPAPSRPATPVARPVPAAQPVPQPVAQPMRAPMPQSPRQAPVPAGPRSAPAFSPVQPVFARIRPATPAPRPIAAPFAGAPAPLPMPVEETVMQAPAPGQLQQAESDTDIVTEAVFKRNLIPTPAALAPSAPVFSPIAPEVAKPMTGGTEVIKLPGNYRTLPASSAPLEAVVPVMPITPIAPEPEPEPEPIRFSGSTAPEPPPVPVTTGETRFITVSVAELAGAWPEVVRNEINTQNLSGSWIGLPLGAVEGVMKTGKLTFPWKALRSWVKPPVPPAPSQYDTTMLELPLKIITPLFLAELKATRTQKKFAVDEDIPDLFFNSQPVETAPNMPVVPIAPITPALPVPPPPPPVAPPRPIGGPVPNFPAAAETARPADTNYFVWKQNPDQEETTVFNKKGGATPGTAFLNRYATPNEIVSKAAALDGVDGALIALPDGLLVASRIPNNMNADTIAAFLPQIFGRVSQCTRELRLGELNNLNFTVGNIPWKIFRVGSIYFAAFGRPGVPLPTAQLVGLAAELDRKAK